ncbi:RNA-binding domain-containing protein [Anaeromyces robustus]|uniref:RNA-binding domain-containing protein n=1 Tax=Anaeromyces robustus TaxID=1754192 RepID=A0A1Y1X7F0_9FUNG|nr:RNA-binding domain-containing protein [Anaeromyces robustus]|eukprot:ORX81691.1 RNA-binding domain-containing protein [Anaeromyces robustus]
MSSNTLDMSLDDLIKKNRKSRLQSRRRRLNNDKTGGIGRRDRNTLNNRRRNKDDGSKILISNLAYNVTSKDLKDLFKDIGPVKSTAINFLPNGKSKGTGQVIFIRANDARRAINKYNNVELDGRPMKIEMVLTSAAALTAMRGKQNIRNRSNRMRRRRNRNNEPLKTQEELDAEMDSYMKVDDANVQPQSNTDGNTNSAVVA